MSGMFEQTVNILLLIFGFGFVIFWHELGHFLAAKWAGVKVDQFAVGFGQALISWRKGLGFRVGSSAKEYEQYVQAAREGVQNRDVSQISETEYRLNWIPLGGYVKMLGQDDLNPNAVADDPRAYNMKPIRKRMVIVSAGVIMNVILAAIGFFVLFLIGFDVPPPVVGSIAPNSPAQRAGVQVGDRVVEFDGRVQRDFTKIQMNVALVKEGEAVPLKIQRRDGTIENVTITAERATGDKTGFLALGVGTSERLDGAEPRKRDLFKDQFPESAFVVKPDERVIAINGKPVAEGNEAPEQAIKHYWKLDRAAQESDGKPIQLTLSNGATTRDITVQPHLADPFSGTFNLAGFVPRATVYSIISTSKALGKLKEGDAIESATVGSDTMYHATPAALRDLFRAAGDNKQAVDLVVVRDGQTLPLKGLETTDLKGGGRGLGVQMDYDDQSAVIGAILPDSAASRSDIALDNSSDVTIVKLGDEPVHSFFDLKRILAAAKPGKLPIVLKSDAGETTHTLPVSESDIANARNELYRVDLVLHDLSEPRKTKNFLTAAQWGLEETRDLIVQFYITLQRMFSGSVSAKNMMGPWGIGKAGLGFASRGTDYLIWFLAMISANLAVVNFLPIPIVDGGLFLFLLIEKFQGKPLSPRVQSIAQLVGLALIASVFIFVTYQDIMRR